MDTNIHSKLSKLNSFDPKAFIGDEKCPQELCSLVLALSLIFNDLKDTFLLQIHLEKIGPKGTFKETPAWGQHYGLQLHQTRTRCGITNELINLIEEKKHLFDIDFFVELRRKLSTEVRESWDSLLDAALRGKLKTPIGRLVHFVRNKVGFHYDLKELAKAYSHAFVTNKIMDPYVSRGRNLEETRFYFSDATAQAYFDIRIDDEEAKSFIRGDAPILKQINVSLYSIVTSFVQQRGFAWKEVSNSKI